MIKRDYLKIYEKKSQKPSPGQIPKVGEDNERLSRSQKPKVQEIETFSRLIKKTETKERKD